MNHFLERLKEDLVELMYTLILMIIVGTIIVIFMVALAYILIAITLVVPQ